MSRCGIAGCSGSRAVLHPQPGVQARPGIVPGAQPGSGLWPVPAAACGSSSSSARPLGRPLWSPGSLDYSDSSRTGVPPSPSLSTQHNFLECVLYPCSSSWDSYMNRTDSGVFGAHILLGKANREPQMIVDQEGLVGRSGGGRVGGWGQRCSFQSGCHCLRET